MPSDAELLRAFAQSGSEVAFAEFVRRHLNLVYFAALRRTGGNSTLAEEIAQTVFTEAARRGAMLARHGSVTGWLYTTTRNTAVMTLRKESARQRREQEAHRMHELQSTETAANWDTLRPLIDEALDTLPASDREAVLLRFFEGQPFAVIGDALRVSEDAARMRVERALGKLHALLTKRGVTSTAGALAAALEAQTALAAPAGLGASIASAACGAAVAPAGPLVGLVQIMANTKLLVGGAALLACLVSGVAVREVVLRRDAEAALVAAQRSREAQIAEIKVLQQRAHEAQRDGAELAATLEQRRSALAAGARDLPAEKPASRADETLSPMQRGNAFLARHPGVKAALDQWANAAVDGRWSTFYRSRALTPTQIDEFRFLTRPRSFIPGTEPDGELIQLFTGAWFAQDEIDRRLRVLLGEPGFAEYQQRKETSTARNAADELAGALCFSEAPLAPGQYEQLIATLQQHRVATDSEARAPGRFDWVAVTRDAVGFLMPAQLAKLDSVRAQDAFGDLWDRAPSPLETARKPAQPVQ